MNPSRKITFFMILLGLCAPFGLAAQPESEAEPESGPSRELGVSEAPLAIQGEAVLTQAEIDAAFSKIPAIHRNVFIRDGERVNAVIANLLRNKLIAADARRAGFDQERLVQLSMSLAYERELARAWTERIVEDAPPADYEALAEEAWLADPEAWKTEDRVDVSHILISSEKRPAAEALALAEDLREQLEEDPELWDELVEAHSEDPSKSDNGGRFPAVKKGDMVKAFERTAFALEQPGQISQPVETNYGYHLIRLNRKLPGVVPPFEAVKAEAMAQAEANYLKDYRSRYLRRLLSEPIELPEGAVEEMAKRYFGENLELAPAFGE
ncbi:MAG: peptidylprolyl isomerase [Xanthomonadales bacterium]|nr:peptidylprolyl isomerase [Xanthomonadales bacterium]